MATPLKILVTGQRGQVGWELQRTLMSLGQVIAVDREQMDLTDEQAIRQTLAAIQPDVIVNAAAYTAVDKAETEQEFAFKINAIAPKILAEDARNRHALLIHYSTDYVFDGSKIAAYLETDTPAPINAYGASKLAGEQAIQAVAGDYLIFRTSWVYGSRGQNFLLTMLRLMREREQLSVVGDQIGAPTWSRLIAEATALSVKQAIMERQQGRFHSGLYHLTSRGDTSWYEFAQAIWQLAQQTGLHSSLKIKQLAQITTAQYPTPAKRPLNSRLATQAVCERFGLHLPRWDAALALCMEEGRAA